MTPWPPHRRGRRRRRGGHEPEGGVRHAALRTRRSWVARRRRCASWPSTCAPDGLGRRGPHDLRARRHHLGRRPGAGDHRVNGVTVHRHPSAHGRLPDFYGLDGTVRLAPPGDTGTGKAVGRLQRPCLPAAGRRRVRVERRRRRLLPVPLPPHRGDHRQGPRAGGVPSGGARRAGFVPVGVPWHLRGRRRLLLLFGVGAHPRRADVPGGGAPPDRARSRGGRLRGAGRPGGELVGLGERPYVVSVGRVDEHKGSKMLASYFATYKERTPGRSPSPSSGRSRWSSRPTPTSW